MKTTEKIKLVLLFIAIIFIACAMTNKCSAQTDKGSLSVGDKTIEFGYIRENEEGLGFGAAVSIVHSGLVEKRANKNDHFNEHELVSKVTPALFGLISGNFEEVTVIGKIGGAYINQNINGIRDNKKLFFAVGIAFEVPVTEEISVRAGYDNVNSVLIGVGFKI